MIELVISVAFVALIIIYYACKLNSIYVAKLKDDD